MDSTSRSSKSSKILHSTPKSISGKQFQHQSRCSRPCRGTTQCEHNDSIGKTNTYTALSIGTSSRTNSQQFEHRTHSDTYNRSDSHGLEETGDSTRSLLSVLSHSSVERLSTGNISDSFNTSSPSKQEDKTSRSCDNSTVQSSSTSESKEAKLTSWEEWLLKKAQEEREKVHNEVRKKLMELKANKKEDEKQKERRSHIEKQVVLWLKEKERLDKKKVNRDERIKKVQQQQKKEENQLIAEREKVERENWLSKKREKEKLQKEKESIEKQKKTMDERERKEKAEEAFKKWKQESKFKPRPSTGSFYGKGHVGDSSYPVPGYCNPNPWMPIHIPSSMQATKDSGKRKKNAKKANKEIFQSPPLLFKDKTNKAITNAWGRPR